MAPRKEHPPYPNFICSLWAVLWLLLPGILIILVKILLQHFLWNSSIKLLHFSPIVLIKWNWTNKISKVGHFRHNTQSLPLKKWPKCKQIFKLILMNSFLGSISFQIQYSKRTRNSSAIFAIKYFELKNTGNWPLEYSATFSRPEQVIKCCKIWSLPIIIFCI